MKKENGFVAMAIILIITMAIIPLSMLSKPLLKSGADLSKDESLPSTSQISKTLTSSIETLTKEYEAQVLRMMEKAAENRRDLRTTPVGSKKESDLIKKQEILLMAISDASSVRDGLQEMKTQAKVKGCRLDQGGIAHCAVALQDWEKKGRVNKNVQLIGVRLFFTKNNSTEWVLTGHKEDFTFFNK